MSAQWVLRCDGVGCAHGYLLGYGQSVTLREFRERAKSEGWHHVACSGGGRDFCPTCHAKAMEMKAQESRDEADV